MPSNIERVIARVEYDLPYFVIDNLVLVDGDLIDMEEGFGLLSNRNELSHHQRQELQRVLQNRQTISFISQEEFRRRFGSLVDTAHMIYDHYRTIAILPNFEDSRILVAGASFVTNFMVANYSIYNNLDHHLPRSLEVVYYASDFTYMICVGLLISDTALYVITHVPELVDGIRNVFNW